MASASSAPRIRRSHLSIEELEPRLVLAGVQPTVLEQVLLERLNDIRADPAAYGQSIGLDLSAVAPSQPLAFDTALIAAARGHSQDMNDQGYFGHVSSTGQNLGQRISAAGFAWTTNGESIAAGFASVDAALRALIVDNGIPDLGHRRHLLAIDAIFKNQSAVGVGLALNGSGPYTNYFTIDTAAPTDTRPYLTGAVFNDLNNNGKYDAGEGLGAVTMQVRGVGSVQTFTTGGFSMQLAPGTYTVSFSGPGLSAPITRTVALGATNYRLNILSNAAGQSPSSPPVVSDQELSQLEQQYGFRFLGSFLQNAHGYNERWIQDRLGNWYALTTTGELVRWDGKSFATSLQDPVATLDASIYTNPNLLLQAPVKISAATQSQLSSLQHDYGFHFLNSYFQNTYGYNERWFLDRQENWFALTPEGALVRWNGKSFASSLLHPVATVDPAVYDNPALLLQAPVTLSAPVQSQLNVLQQQYGFHFLGSYMQGAHGYNERWFQDQQGNWFALTPAGLLVRWDGNSFASSLLHPAATVDPAVYDNPALLFQATTPAPSISQTIAQLKQTYGFQYLGTYYQNSHGYNERWFQDRQGNWFALTPDGVLVRWDGQSFASSLRNPVATLNVWVYADPTQLF